MRLHADIKGKGAQVFNADPIHEGRVVNNVPHEMHQFLGIERRLFVEKGCFTHVHVDGTKCTRNRDS